MLTSAAFGPAISLDGLKSQSAYFLQRVMGVGLKLSAASLLQVRSLRLGLAVRSRRWRCGAIANACRFCIMGVVGGNCALPQCEGFIDGVKASEILVDI